MNYTVDELMVKLYELYVDSLYPYFNSPESLEWKKFDIEFIKSIAGFISRGSSLSSKQGDICIKLLYRYLPYLLQHHSTLDEKIVKSTLRNKVFKQPLYQSKKIEREVRIIDGNKLLFRFSWNEDIKEALKKIAHYNYKDGLYYPYFNMEHKLWIHELTTFNYQSIINFIDSFKFSFGDDEYVIFSDYEARKDKNPEITYDNETKLVHIEPNKSMILDFLIQYISMMEK